MRHLFLLIIASLFIGCGGSEEPPPQRISEFERDQRMLNNRIDIELSKDERHDTIFMNYRLGMSVDELVMHSARLVRDGKLIDDKKNTNLKAEITVETEDGLESRLASIGWKTHNDSLYLFTLLFDYKGSKISGPRLIRALKTMYFNKYGLPLMLKSSGSMGVDKNIWINGNRVITIDNESNVVFIEYKDSAIEKRVKAQNEIILDELESFKDSEMNRQSKETMDNI